MARTALLLVLLLAAPAWAQGLSRIADESQFRERIVGRDLTRLGVGVVVTADGRITGNALGGSVTGSWTWRDGYFCREMSWTSREWPMNCQAVYVGGDTVRFIADRGQGDSADLTLR